MKEGMGLTRKKYVNNCQCHGSSGAYSVATSRLKPAFQATSLRTKMSSDYYWGRSRSKTLTSIKDEGGRLSAPSTNISAAQRLCKAGRQYERESVEDSCQAGDGNREWIPLSKVCPESDENMISEMFVSFHVQSNRIQGREPAPMSGSRSVIPVGSKSQQQTINNPGESPFSLYPTGPPVPFLSMLPVYNLPADEFNNFQDSVCDCSMDSTDNRDQVKVLYSSNSMVDCASADPSDNQMSDILSSDSASHWQNLHYLRFCQDAWHYPSPVVLPPTYSHGYSSSEDPGATPPEDMNFFNQLTHCSPHLIPISPLWPSFSQHAGLHQHCADKIPRYYCATGLKVHHSPISSVGSQYPNARNHRGKYKGYHVYDEGSRNISSKSQYAGHYPDFTQVAMPGMRMNCGQDYVNAPYGMHPVAILDEASESGTGAPPADMLYSYDEFMCYAAPSEHLEFRPLGPEFFSGVDEASYLGEVSRSGFIEPQDMEGYSKLSSTNQPSLRQGPRSWKKRIQKKDWRRL
ncbi:hypothetical protein HS088_TW08G00052 [Tripterygium wilfordii]|uniref:Uncharacterized protein n=1 Tax=Tripterygium wilfordii TaxID=458696 RepID=A0A7J7DB36_TRIWF|nr:hypothetical protein HS088_TW08G00052 [Tripterygium wilfordii]